MSVKKQPTLLSLWLQRLDDSAELPLFHWLDPAKPKGTPQKWSYAALNQEVCRFIAILQQYKVKAGDRTLILAENSPQWQTFSLASQALRCESAALFATLNASQVGDILKRAQPKAIFISTQEQWDKIEPSLTELPQLKVIFGLADDIKIKGPIPYYSYQQVIAEKPCSSETFRELCKEVQGDDPFILIFTSGTTGHQKGVRISQYAFYKAIEAGTATLAGLPQKKYSDVPPLCAYCRAMSIRHGHHEHTSPLTLLTS